MALPLRTERLVIVQPHPSHFEELYDHVLSQAPVMQYIGDGKPWSRGFAYKRFLHNIHLCQHSPYGQWTLIESKTAQIIGQCGLIPVAYKGPLIEIGYRLAQASWGKGYATEAVLALTPYALATHAQGGLGLEKLLAVTYPQNTASQKVLQKTGYTYKGLTTQFYGTHTTWYEYAR
jgi:ribosomal-protein-alanine N-acetyltransferase